MGLESVTFISDLVVTNPVGATDPKSQGDDHIRNLKLAIKNTFPNITGAVTLTQAQLNVAALTNVANVFTSNQMISSTNPRFYMDDTNAGSGLRQFFLESEAGSFSIASATDAGSGVQNALVITKNSSGTITGFAITATSITLNGVASSDFARLSQANTFSLSGANDQTITATSANRAGLRFQTSSVTRGFIAATGLTDDLINGSAVGDMILRAESGSFLMSLNAGVNLHHKFTSSNTTTSFNGVAVSDFARLSQANIFTQVQSISMAGANATWQATRTGGTGASVSMSASDPYGIIGTTSNSPVAFITNSSTRFEISATGAFDFKGGAVTTNDAAATEVGFKGAPTKATLTTSSNTANSNAGGAIHFTGGSGQTFTLDADPPTDSVVMLVNRSGNNWTIAASGTLTFNNTTGSRTMATGTLASALHLGSGNWYISGGGLT